MKGFFRLLDIALANKKDYFTKPVLGCEPCVGRVLGFLKLSPLNPKGLFLSAFFFVQ
jgi:hypothetical protein